MNKKMVRISYSMTKTILSIVFMTTILLTAGIAASAIILSVSFVIAQQPVVYFSEIEIIEDSKRENGYIFIGNVCVSSEEILDPKVLLISDLEKKTLQLIHVFHSKECFGAVERIRASDPDSIHVKIVSFGDNSQIQVMQTEIEDLEKQLEKQQRELSETQKKRFDHHQDYIDAVKEKANKLWITEKQLQHKTAQFYEMMSYLHPDLVELNLEDFKAISCPEKKWEVKFDVNGRAYCKPRL